MSQGPSQIKASTSRSASNAAAPGSRLLQNYPQEPIGTRPSYVGELVAILRDGTPELRGLLESECDLRFNCKVCGSILPSTRSFVIHKRQFCTTKYVEYQRRNVAIMERISNVVSFETKSLQTEDDEMLELDNPINASLLVPLAQPAYLNGQSSRSPRTNGTSEEKDESEERKPSGTSRFNSEFIPEGVEVVQPSRPPADGVYRFGMGGTSLVTSKKKKSRVHASGTVKKKRKQVVMIRDSFSSPKKHNSDSSAKKADFAARFPRDGPIMTVSKPPPPKNPVVFATAVAPPPKATAPPIMRVTHTDVEMTDGAKSASPSVSAAIMTTGLKRSRRLGPPINGFDSGKPPVPARLTMPSAPKPDPKTSADSSSTSKDTEEGEKPRDVKDPVFIRGLLDQMCEVADYPNKKCRDCNRNVVSIYNLDRHVATQHLGLKESEYSLISKELRRLRTEKFGPLKTDGTEGTERSLVEAPVDESQTTPASPVVNGDAADHQSADNSEEREEEEEVRNDDKPQIPTTSKTSDSDKITERLTAMIRNPDTLKEILTTKEKDHAPVDYELDQLVEIQRQIIDAADPYLQNRHIMTVHLRLPERSCGTINKMIKDSMKRFPHAFGTMMPIADSLSD